MGWGRGPDDSPTRVWGLRHRNIALVPLQNLSEGGHPPGRFVSTGLPKPGGFIGAVSPIRVLTSLKSGSGSSTGYTGTWQAGGYGYIGGREGPIAALIGDRSGARAQLANHLWWSSELGGPSPL